MSQVATLTGHTYRVLYLAMSPDGQTICTGAGDETLRLVPLLLRVVRRVLVHILRRAVLADPTHLS